MPIISLDTAPPKSILKPEMTLLDSKLTPRALLYFGTSAPEESKSYIKSSFTSTLTLPALASQAALQYRLAFSLTLSRRKRDSVVDTEFEREWKLDI